MNIKAPKNILSELIEDEFDFDYRAESIRINTIEEFDNLLLAPSNNGGHIYYRGERIQSITRPLLPTIFRNRDLFFDDGKMVCLVDSDYLYSLYSNKSSYFELYESIIGKVDASRMYPFLAFSQHYFGISPLIDFSKSLDVALSFALKDRTEFKRDILLYTLEFKNPNDYTNDVEVANKWISDYSVALFNNAITGVDISTSDSAHQMKHIFSYIKGRSFIDMTSPSAKLIDVPMNDLMRYQQGVFLLLDDFTLIGHSYLTKRIRDEFAIHKWVINKEICPLLSIRIQENKPYYSYKNITNLSKVVAEYKRKSTL